MPFSIARQESTVGYPDYEWIWSSNQQQLLVRRIHRRPTQDDKRNISHAHVEPWQVAKPRPPSVYALNTQAANTAVHQDTSVHCYYPPHDPQNVASWFKCCLHDRLERFPFTISGSKKTITLYLVRGSKRVEIEAHYAWRFQAQEH